MHLTCAHTRNAIAAGWLFRAAHRAPRARCSSCIRRPGSRIQSWRGECTLHSVRVACMRQGPCVGWRRGRRLATGRGPGSWGSVPVGGSVLARRGQSAVARCATQLPGRGRAGHARTRFRVPRSSKLREDCRFRGAAPHGCMRIVGTWNDPGSVLPSTLVFAFSCAVSFTPGRVLLGRRLQL